MAGLINIYSLENNEIKRFLEDYYKMSITVKDSRLWEKEYQNPVDMADLIGIYIDNNYKYKINMWISFDPNYYINVTDYNADKIIRYLFERYPY